MSYASSSKKFLLALMPLQVYSDYKLSSRTASHLCCVTSYRLSMWLSAVISIRAASDFLSITEPDVSFNLSRDVRILLIM